MYTQSIITVHKILLRSFLFYRAIKQWDMRIDLTFFSSPINTKGLPKISTLFLTLFIKNFKTIYIIFLQQFRWENNYFLYFYLLQLFYIYIYIYPIFHFHESAKSIQKRSLINFRGLHLLWNLICSALISSYFSDDYEILNFMIAYKIMKYWILWLPKKEAYINC